MENNRKVEDHLQQLAPKEYYLQRKKYDFIEGIPQRGVERGREGGRENQRQVHTTRYGTSAVGVSPCVTGHMLP